MKNFKTSLMLKSSTRRSLLLGFFCILLLTLPKSSFSQNVFNDLYLKKAKQLLPALSHHRTYPAEIIELQKDAQVWLGWKTSSISSANNLPNLRLQKSDTLILDFGRHVVGYLQGEVQGKTSILIETAEVLAELGDSWDQYPPVFDNGYIPSKGWTSNLNIENNWRLEDRRAFRYARIIIHDALDKVFFSSIYCDEVSIIPFENIRPLNDFGSRMKQIDLVSQYTLRNCMQEVFEDGPKRDQRLWLGDLRLQASSAALLYKSDSLIKRCLLLFAGMQRADGFLPACIFTDSGINPEIGDEMIPDYAMLFGSVLLDYSKSTNDWQLASELYPLAHQQVMLVCNSWLDSEYRLQIPDSVWAFIDWNKKLNRQAAEQATAIYSIKAIMELATHLGKKEDLIELRTLTKRLTNSSLKNFYDREKGLFVSGPQKQISWATQIWMILAGVVDQQAGAKILSKLNNQSGAIEPDTPYLMHHLVQAYLLCGMDIQAYQLIDSYWGGMVDKGADTFWEVYDPKDAFKSPYNSHLFNSYCHAWSCTPSWFFRHPVYGKRIQRMDSK
jgi:alpha-L-rhamnosidase